MANQSIMSVFTSSNQLSSFLEMQPFESILGRSCPLMAFLVSVSILIAVDVFIAAYAFFEFLRIHLRSQQLGWTRQKVFHLMIGSYNVGYATFFISSLVAACLRWRWWSRGCGFILMACPQILFLATFLLLLSFWTDIYHEASDDEEEDDDLSISESLLEESNNHRCSLPLRARCCSFFKVHMGSRQKYAFLVIVLTFLFMITMALLIWLPKGKNSLDPSLMFKVYLDVYSVFIIILGVALAFYGGILFSKMRKIRTNRPSSDVWKVASLTAVSLVCFASSSAFSLFTSIPMLSHGHNATFGCINGPVFVCLYYAVGSSVPSSFMLWAMRESPSHHIDEEQPEPRVLTIFTDSPPPVQPKPRWRTAVTNSLNKLLKISPI